MISPRPFEMTRTLYEMTEYAALVNRTSKEYYAGTMEWKVDTKLSIIMNFVDHGSFSENKTPKIALRDFTIVKKKFYNIFKSKTVISFKDISSEEQHLILNAVKDFYFDANWGEPELSNSIDRFL